MSSSWWCGNSKCKIGVIYQAIEYFETYKSSSKFNYICNYFQPFFHLNDFSIQKDKFFKRT